MKMSYSDFANVYDSLMQGVDYPKMCEKYLSLLKLHSHTPRLVLDAACGTGAFTFELCSRGFDVVGVDCSQEMLSVARERIGDKALLLCQELQHLDLYGTIDTVFCTLDGLNHITDFDELRASIKKIALFTEPCGMFIFDVNTLFKHEQVLGNNTFVLEDENVYTVWSNEYKDDGLTEFTLDFFSENQNGTYTRTGECFQERAYSDESLTKLLSDCGFTVVARYDFDTADEPEDDSEKIIYIAKRNDWSIQNG